MELFYAHPDHISASQIELDKFESRHLLTTLKKKQGATLSVTDGEGTIYQAEIESTKSPLALSIQSKKKCKPYVLNLALGIGFIRPNRLDFLLEKATELGVSRFYLIKSHHANYVSNNVNRYQKILRQAIKQSQRPWLPEIFICKNLAEYIVHSKFDELKLCAADSTSPAISSRFRASGNDNFTKVNVAIGPEGGFSKEEIEALENDAFLSVSLGHWRLRSETAAINLISAVQVLLNINQEVSLGK
jgi:16S rRNA (uracil1498-N3)-methyltransferase